MRSVVAKSKQTFRHILQANVRMLVIGATAILVTHAFGQADSLARGNYISVAHEYAWFKENATEWNTTVLEARFETNNQWSFLPRAYFSNRFDQTGWLGEVDAYHTFKSKDYLFLQVGYSPDPIFPNYKLGAEYFHQFAKKWEYSLGARYFAFSSTNNIVLWTGSLSKYSGSHLTIFRPFVGIQGTGDFNNLTFTLQHRYYRNEKEYVGIFGNFGYNPGLLLFAENTSVQLTQAEQYGGGITSTHLLSDRWRMTGQFEYIFMDLGSATRNQYLATVKVQYLWR